MKVLDRLPIIGSVWAVVLLCLPIWYITTKVHRAPLPFSQIRTWSDIDKQQIVFVNSIVVSMPSPLDSVSIAQRVEHAVNHIYNSTAEAAPSARLKFKVLAEDTLAAAPQSRLDSKSHSFVSLECNSNAQRLVNIQEARHARVGLAQDDCQDENLVVQVLSSLIAELFLEEAQALGRIRKPVNDRDHDEMRAIKFAPEYQITFSLLNSEPADWTFSWDIRGAVNEYIAPFLDQLEGISKFKVGSQIQNYAPLSVTPRRRVLPESGTAIHVLPTDVLPSFVNSAEWNLASAVSSNPPLNFLLYIPSHSSSPLYLLDSKEHIVGTNAFLIPQWGGVAIENPAIALGEHRHFRSWELQPIMEIFLGQLRGLLGIKATRLGRRLRTVPFDFEITVESSPSKGITQWELARLIRKRTAQNLLDAIATLNSLATLISDMENMVVLDEIRTKVVGSLEALDQGYQALARGDIDTASQHATTAIVLSESAFFDPTMVSLLYFPDEHKFAVYMPLFVPISVPLLSALLQYWRERRKQRQEKESVGKTKKDS